MAPTTDALYDHRQGDGAELFGQPARMSDAIRWARSPTIRKW
jgi:hypothetical protein